MNESCTLIGFGKKRGKPANWMITVFVFSSAPLTPTVELDLLSTTRRGGRAASRVTMRLRPEACDEMRFEGGGLRAGTPIRSCTPVKRNVHRLRDGHAPAPSAAAGQFSVPLGDITKERRGHARCSGVTISSRCGGRISSRGGGRAWLTANGQGARKA